MKKALDPSDAPLLILSPAVAGNIESHSTLGDSKELGITNVLDQKHYGFSKITFHSAKKLTWQFIRGVDGAVGDELTLMKGSS